MASKKIVDIQQTITDDGNGKYFHIMLNMYDDDLDPYQYRLLGHYRRVCGQGGTCYEATATTADICKMSVRKVKSTRKSLQEKGYINIEPQKGSTLVISIADKMHDNVSRYRGGVHEVHGGRASGARGGVHEVHPKNNHIQEEPLEEEKESSGSVPEPDKDPTPTPEPVPEKTSSDGDQYLLLQEPLDRLDSLRNECKLVKEPDKRTNYKGYTKHPFYEQTKRVFMYGCAIDGQPFERWSGLGPLVRWFHNEALGKNGQPATLLELVDFMTWYHRDTSGYNMPRERSRMVHHWGRWKKATDKRQSRRVLNGDPRNMSPLARTPEQQAHAWKKKVG